MGGHHQETVSASDAWFTKAVAVAKESVLRLVKPTPNDRYRKAVPLIRWKIAAGRV